MHKIKNYFKNIFLIDFFDVNKFAKIIEKCKNSTFINGFEEIYDSRWTSLIMVMA